jgi:hypothetical protein
MSWERSPPKNKVQGFTPYCVEEKQGSLCILEKSTIGFEK